MNHSEESNVTTLQKPKFNAEHQWVSQLITAPCVWIAGPMSSGKTAKLSYLCTQAKERGEQVFEIDQPAEDVVMTFVEEVKRRSKLHGFNDYDPLQSEPHWKLACDEICNSLAPLLDWLQLLRGVNMSVVCVSPSNEASDVINRQFVRLLTEVDPTGKHCAGSATLFVPNEAAKRVKIPNWMQ